MKSIQIKSPNVIAPNGNKSLFCAGTIDNGSAFEWANELFKKVEESNLNLNVYNPRRDDWDSSWTQSIDNPQFYEQVSWELQHMEKADYIIVNFLPDSKSPITLLELGIHANSGKLIVCCPKEFYRSGNVHIVCERYKIPLFHNIDHAFNHLVHLIKTN